MKRRAVDIVWDTDGEQVDLPQEIKLPTRREIMQITRSSGLHNDAQNCIITINNVSFRSVTNAYVGMGLDPDAFCKWDSYDETLRKVARLSAQNALKYKAQHPEEFHNWSDEESNENMEKLVFSKFVYTRTHMKMLLDTGNETLEHEDENGMKIGPMLESVRAKIHNLVNTRTPIRRTIQMLCSIDQAYGRALTSKDAGKQFFDELGINWKKDTESGMFSDFLTDYISNKAYAVNDADTAYENFILNYYLKTNNIINMLKPNVHDILDEYIKDINASTPYQLQITPYFSALTVVEKAIRHNILIPNADGLIAVYQTDGTMQLMSKEDIARELRYDNEGLSLLLSKIEKAKNIRVFHSYKEMEEVHISEEIAAMNKKDSEEWTSMKQRHCEERRLFENDFEHLCEEFIYIMANHEYPQSGDLMLVLSDAGKTIDDIKNDERIRAAFNEACTHRLHLIV